MVKITKIKICIFLFEEYLTIYNNEFQVLLFISSGCKFDFSILNFWKIIGML